MNERKDANLVDSLHNMWEDVENKCKEQKHKGRIAHWLNYAHVQKVTCCAHCFRWGQEEHTNIYNEITGSSQHL